MHFVRSLPILVSVLVAAGFWSFGVAAPVVDGYAALVCSEAIPDREIVQRLESQGIDDLVSESGQWVLLDNFEKVERIPLDEYHERLLPFDPRNDHYADKLRSLFIQDEKRIVYIPVNSAIPVLEKKLAAALGDIPYTFEYGSRGDSPVLFFVLFGLAAVVFIIVRPLRLALRPDAASLAPCLLALTPLALVGAIGFTQASLLAGCAVLLAGPCLERLTLRRRYRLRQKWQQASPGPLVLYLQRLRPMPRLLPLVFLGCYVAIAVYTGLHLVFMLLVLVLFCGIFAFSMWAGSIGVAAGAGRDTRFAASPREPGRFSPVPIFGRQRFSFTFSWVMLPFTVIALALVIISPPVSAPTGFSFALPAGAVTEADYYNHYLFQSTFSLRPLREVRPLHETAPYGGYDQFSPMSVYELAPDGLPYAVKDGSASGESLIDSIPPFPLAELMRYLNAEPARSPDTAHHSMAGPYNTPKQRSHERLSALLPLLFIVPALIRSTRGS
jgi:hypothetical protein